MSHHQVYAYLVASYNNTVHTLNQLQARITDLDTALSDPTVKGKERKRIRHTRFQAEKSRVACHNILNNLTREMADTVSQFHTVMETAALANYLPQVQHISPVAVFGPPDDVYGDNMSDRSSIAGSWLSSAGAEWNSHCAEYPHSLDTCTRSTAPCLPQPQNSDSQASIPPGEGPECDNALEQGILLDSDGGSVVVESDSVGMRRATMIETYRTDGKHSGRDPGRHSIAEAPLREPDMSFPNYEWGLVEGNTTPMPRSA